MTLVPVSSMADVLETVDLLGAVKRVVDSQWYVLGKEVSEFEREFAHYCGVPHCVGVANGTEALELALRSLGIGAGDRVALAANAGFYGSHAIHMIGAIPIYGDIDPRSLTLAPAALRTILESGVKAIIATHLYGQLADIAAISALAAEFRVSLIEDCAQAHGASLGGRRAGSFGTVGCFSFYPTKNLGALGDGGAVISSNAEIAASVRQLRQYGWDGKYHVKVPGGRNSRLDEMQAAVLRAKLPHLDTWNAKRRAVARTYNEAFAALPLSIPSSAGDDTVSHLYVVRVDDREKFRSVLKASGIATDIHYPVPDHLQPAYPCQQTKGSLPVTEAACDSVVTLPCFSGIHAEQVERVIAAVKLATR